MFMSHKDKGQNHADFLSLVCGLNLERKHLDQLSYHYYFGDRKKVENTVHRIREHMLRKYNGINIPPLPKESCTPLIPIGQDSYYGNVHGFYSLEDFFLFVLRGTMGSGKSSTFHSILLKVLANNPVVGFVKIELKRPELRHFRNKIYNLTGRKLWVISKDALAFNPFQIFIKTLDHISLLANIVKSSLGLFQSGPTQLLFNDILTECYIERCIFDGKTNTLPQNEDFPVLSEFIDDVKAYPVKGMNKSEAKTRLLDKFTDMYNSTRGDSGCFGFTKGLDLNVLQNKICVIELFGLQPFIQQLITLYIFRNLYEIRMMSI